MADALDGSVPFVILWPRWQTTRNSSGAACAGIGLPIVTNSSSPNGRPAWVQRLSRCARASCSAAACSSFRVSLPPDWDRNSVVQQARLVAGVP